MTPKTVWARAPENAECGPGVTPGKRYAPGKKRGGPGGTR